MSSVTIDTAQLQEIMTSFPTFWRTSTAVRRADSIKGLLDFYRHIFNNYDKASSQLFQDLFVDFIFEEKKELRFLEFGATDGVELSNTKFLEDHRGWSGVLAEPDPQWQSRLKNNRPSAQIITDCIYSSSGKSMEFISSSAGVLSSLKEHALEDSDGQLAGNAISRMESYTEVKVSTISLNDVIDLYFTQSGLDYMSVDTEGSEFEILSHFDFGKCRPGVFTVEHNYSKSQALLDKLFKEAGYTRVFQRFTEFDAWYVQNDLARARGLIL